MSSKLKKIKLLYNPAAGDRTFPHFLDCFLQKFEKAGYIIDIYRSLEQGDLKKGLEDISENKNIYKNIVVAGGDGSLNEVINGMMEKNINLPLGIIPAGTANDFATYLKMPTNYEKCFDIILKGNIKTVDLGKINNRYFINVCMVGEFSNIPQVTDSNLKTILGKLAYYINGLREIPKMKPIPFRITTTSEILEEELYLLVILNSKRAGGFDNLSPAALVNDGMFDFIGLKLNDIYELPVLLMKLLQGNHIKSDKIIYLQSDFFKIECMNHTYNYQSDIDGENGPGFPLEIRVLPRKIKVITD